MRSTRGHSGGSHLKWTLEDHRALVDSITKLSAAFTAFVRFEKGNVEMLTNALQQTSEELYRGVDLDLAPYSALSIVSGSKNEATVVSPEGGGALNRPDSTPQLGVEEVLKYFFELASKTGLTFVIQFCVDHRSKLHSKITITGKNEDLKQIQAAIASPETATANRICCDVEVEGASEFFFARLTYDSIEKWLEFINIPIEKKITPESVVEALNRMRDRRLNHRFIPQLVGTQNTTGGVSPRVNLQSDCSKAVATIVAGESGSGKSVFGLWGAGSTVPVLYVSLTADDFQDKDLSHHEEYNPCRSLIRIILFALQSELEDSKRALFRTLSGVLNWKRNQLAVGIFHEALDRELLASSSKFQDKQHEADKKTVSQWLQQSDPPTLDKLVIVIDEAGRDVRFTDGMLAMSRQFLASHKKFADQLALVLCGSGLDSFHQSLDGSKFLGSDPSLSQTIVMTTPDLSKIRGQDDWPSAEAIQTGTISRILATNARLLTHGVRMVLNSDIVIGHVREEQKPERQAGFGSFALAMDYPVRKYQTMNAVSGEPQKEILFLNAFRYMHSQNLSGEDIPSSSHSFHTTVGDVAKDKLLRIGIAGRRYAQTSPALKFMACKGKTHPLIESSGIALEEIIACHLRRLLESRLTTSDQDAELALVVEYRLKAGWPNPLAPNMDVSAALTRLKESDDTFQDVKNIKKLFTEKRPARAVILRQSNDRAQGFDVAAIFIENDEYSLIVVQSKNWKDSKAAIKKGLSSLGLYEDMGKGETVVAMSEEQAQSAYYSNECTKHLIEAVSGQSDPSITRVIAVKADEFIPSNSEHFEVWTKPMWEPTISALEMSLRE